MVPTMQEDIYPQDKEFVRSKQKIQELFILQGFFKTETIQEILFLHQQGVFFQTETNQDIVFLPQQGGFF